MFHKLIRHFKLIPLKKYSHIIKYLLILIRQKCICFPLHPSPPRSPRPMNELTNVLRRIVTNRSTNPLNIQSSSPQISGDKNLKLAISKILYNSLPILLRFPPMVFRTCTMILHFNHIHYFLTFLPRVNKHNNRPGQSS
jgi:hypothetical protein